LSYNAQWDTVNVIKQLSRGRGDKAGLCPQKRCKVVSGDGQGNPVDGKTGKRDLQPLR